MKPDKTHFFKSIAICISGLLLFLTFSSHAQSNDLEYSVENSFLRIPESIYLKEIYDLAVNKQGELLVLARGPHPISRFSSDGSFLESFGEGLFSQVHSITIDQNEKIWITDVGLHAVFKLDKSGRVEMVLGRQNKKGEFYSDAVPLFNKPTDVIISENGDIFVADGYGNSRIVKFDQLGNYIHTWGVKGNGVSEFNLPHSLAIDKDLRLLVADRENSRIQLFDLNGIYLATWELPERPYCLAIDKNDFIYVTLGKAPEILKLDPDGKVLGMFGSEGKGPGQFVMPHGIETGPDNEIYVAEPINWRVEKFVLK